MASKLLLNLLKDIKITTNEEVLNKQDLTLTLHLMELSKVLNTNNYPPIKLTCYLQAMYDTFDKIFSKAKKMQLSFLIQVFLEVALKLKENFQPLIAYYVPLIICCLDNSRYKVRENAFNCLCIITVVCPSSYLIPLFCQAIQMEHPYAEYSGARLLELAICCFQTSILEYHAKEIENVLVYGLSHSYYETNEVFLEASKSFLNRLPKLAPNLSICLQHLLEGEGDIIVNSTYPNYPHVNLDLLSFGVPKVKDAKILSHGYVSQHQMKQNDLHYKKKLLIELFGEEAVKDNQTDITSEFEDEDALKSLDVLVDDEDDFDLSKILMSPINSNSEEDLTVNEDINPLPQDDINHEHNHVNQNQVTPKVNDTKNNSPSKVKNTNDTRDTNSPIRSSISRKLGPPNFMAIQEASPEQDNLDNNVDSETISRRESFKSIINQQVVNNNDIVFKLDAPNIEIIDSDNDSEQEQDVLQSEINNSNKGTSVNLKYTNQTNNKNSVINKPFINNNRNNNNNNNLNEVYYLLPPPPTFKLPISKKSEKLENYNLKKVIESIKNSQPIFKPKLPVNPLSYLDVNNQHIKIENINSIQADNCIIEIENEFTFYKDDYIKIDDEYVRKTKNINYNNDNQNNLRFKRNNEENGNNEVKKSKNY